MKLKFFSGRSSCSGYTLSEVIVTILIIGILASIAIPGFAKLLPDYRLRIAVQELYSNIHHAKMMAIKANRSFRIVFKTGENGSYLIENPDALRRLSEGAVKSAAKYDINDHIRKLEEIYIEISNKGTSG